jgi:hypothetical protein
MDFEQLSYEALKEANDYMFEKIKTKQHDPSQYAAFLSIGTKDEIISMKLLIEFAKEISRITVTKYHEELVKKLKEKGITLE